MTSPQNLKRDVQVNLRLSEEERDRFMAAARQEGLPFSQWLRRVALKACAAQVQESV